MHVFIQSVYGHFRLDFKALRKHRKRLHKHAAEGPIPRHNVGDVSLEEQIHHSAHQHVARPVKGPFVFREIILGKPVAYYHIHLAVKDKGNHFPCVFRGIGVVPVNHEIAISINLAEHGPYDIALALPVLVSYICARFPGKYIAAVVRIVVVYIDFRLGQSPPVIRNHFFDCHTLIIARYKHSYFHTAFPPYWNNKMRTYHWSAWPQSLKKTNGIK